MIGWKQECVREKIIGMKKGGIENKEEQMVVKRREGTKKGEK